MDVSGEIHTLTALHPWYGPQYQRNKSLGVHHSRSGGLEKNKFSRPAKNRTVIPRLLNMPRASALDGSAAAASILDNIKRPKNVSKMVVQDSLH
jgi:hypothetical protein